MKFAYKKRILFLLTFGTLVYLGFQEHEDSTTNYKRGLFAAILLSIAQGAMSQPHSFFTKGFEAFWRAASRLTVVYLLLLIFIFYQTTDDARQLLKHLDPDLGKPRISGYYSLIENECYFTWRDFCDNIDGSYVIDFIGWFFFTLFVRDASCLRAFSLLNKAFEISWQYQFPSFYKCWWHHLFIDLICNRALAIMLAKKYRLRELDWFGRKREKRFKYWNILKNHRRFGGFWALFVINSTGMLWDFVLMENLWIHDTRHFIKRSRYFIWLILGATSIGEHYEDLETWGTEKRKETLISNEYRWVACGTLVLEIAISLKFKNGVEYSRYQFEKTPLYIPAFWGLGCVAILMYYLYLRLKRNRVTQYGDTPLEIEARNKESSEKEKEQEIEEEKFLQKDRKEQLWKEERKKSKRTGAKENELRKIQEEESSDEESSEDSSEEWSESSEEMSPLRFKL